MSKVNDMLQHYREVRQRLRYPPNAVPDTGINLRRKIEHTSPEPIRLLPPPPSPEVQPSPSYSPFVSKGLTFSSTIEITANEFGLTSQDLHKKTRIRAICFPRQVAIYVAIKREKWSISWMASRLDMDHTSLLHANRKIGVLIETNPELKTRIDSIEATLEARYRPALSDLSEQHLEERAEGILPERPVLEVDRGGGSTLCDEQDRTPADH